VPGAETAREPKYANLGLDYVRCTGVQYTDVDAPYTSELHGTCCVLAPDAIRTSTLEEVFSMHRSVRLVLMAVVLAGCACTREVQRKSQALCDDALLRRRNAEQALATGLPPVGGDSVAAALARQAWATAQANAKAQADKAQRDVDTLCE
jgi:hypothetical protein